MVRSIDTEELQWLLDEQPQLQLVDVLPPSDFEPDHLPGARNLPLTAMTPARVRELDPARPVVVYCFDFQ